MENFRFKWLYLGISLLLIFGFYLNTATADSIPVNTSIPGTSVATQQDPNPAGIIINFYQFALMIGGLLAFVIIVFAAIKHTVSADNPSSQSDAKDMIRQALLGLLLLVGAYVILNTINPRLTNLKLPGLKNISTATSTGGSPGAAGTVGGRCVSNTCESGAFCFVDNKCYANIACSDSDNHITGGGSLVNDSCNTGLSSETGNSITGALCASGICYNTGTNSSCPYGESDCSSGATCVSGGGSSLCKLNGTEGAKCKNGACTETGVECSPLGLCVRTSATDTPCGDTTGSCAQGNCIMDRSNVGRFTCSLTSTGPDGICPGSMTLGKCNDLNPGAGGYCHREGCYSNSNNSGPFPIATGP